MELLLLLVISGLVLFLGYRYYAAFIERVFEVDGSHVAPAVEFNDGVDYVPTRKLVIFSHHFASIAGAGPIIGPTAAMIFGYAPVWLWIVLGTLFIGAVHDFTVLIASMRAKGKSMAEVASGTMGRTGFLLFLSFSIIMLIMLTSVFLNLATTALVSKYPLEYFGSASGLPTTMISGVSYAILGGIASTSVIVVTIFAPIFGILIRRKILNSGMLSLLAVLLTIGAIWIGLMHPLRIDALPWMIILSIYTLLAAGIPVWMLLQPRDFINSFLLYVGVAILAVSSILLGFTGEFFNAPATNFTMANLKLGHVWPLLFITVACGAVSGFHAMVVGGTTAKQVEREKPDARAVGFGGMILEAVLALGVVLAIGVGLEFSQYVAIVYPSDPTASSNPVLAFSLGMAGLMHKSLGIPMIFGAVFGILMAEGFILTTLDTAVRLNRYLLEEMWAVLFTKVPQILKSHTFNAFLCVAAMLFLAYYNAFKELWILFGSANQLLAALSLLVITLWLLERGKQYLFTLIPAAFMLVTTVAALVLSLINKYIPQKLYLLCAGDLILLALAAVVFIIWIKKVVQGNLLHKGDFSKGQQNM